MTLKRRINLPLLVFYGVGVMVGAGIYVLVGKVAGVAGSLTPIAFLVAGAAAALSALSFAELSARLPVSAGEAAYVRSAFGVAWLGDLVGVAVASVGVVSAAAILKGGVGYLLAFVDAPRLLLEVAVGLALGAIAAIGIVESLAVAALFTAIEVVGLAAVSIVGFQGDGGVPFDAMLEFAPLEGAGLSAVFAASVLAFFAFVGFEDMVNLAEEVVDPVKTMPRAIVIAVMITTGLYCLVSVAAIHAVPPAALALSDRPLALVFETATGRPATLIALIAVFATLNGVLAQIVMAARVLYGLGGASRLFAWAHHAHPRLGTPLASTAAATVAVLALAACAPIGALALAATYVLLGIFIVVNAALIMLKRRGAGPAGAPDVPLFVPVAGIVISVALFFA